MRSQKTALLYIPHRYLGSMLQLWGGMSLTVLQKQRKIPTADLHQSDGVCRHDAERACFESLPQRTEHPILYATREGRKAMNYSASRDQFRLQEEVKKGCQSW